MRRLFVYGSLRKGQQANDILKTCTLVKDNVKVPGFDLYRVHWFPGIKENVNNKEGVVGELYELPKEREQWLTELLDNFEGYRPHNEGGSLFLRKEVEIEGQPTSLYVFNKEVPERYAEPLVSGDWVKENAHAS